MKNPAVDAYIAKSAAFAWPILAHLRSLLHKACPKIQETMKWNVPHFEHKGIVAGMAAFKQHASFGFWSHRLLKKELGKDAAKIGWRKITSLKDLPADALLIRAVKAAVVLNEEGLRPAREPKKKPRLKPPAYLLAALRKNVKAKRTFEGFTPAQQGEYVEWLTEAKQAATRERRLATTIEWLAQGKKRNWKYQNC